jgi:phosphatidylglycerophosphate synthase
MIKSDDIIVDYIMKNYDIFENIHPNVITSIGIVCNYFILLNIDNIETHNVNLIIFGILLCVRFLADALDGAVARKYKKSSRLGNILDTVSDLMLLFIVFYFAMIVFKLPNWTIIFYILLLVLINEKYGIFKQHDAVKNNKENIIDTIMNFSTNNTIIVFAIFYAFVIGYDKYKKH